MQIRVDKFICDALAITRKQATQLLKTGEVTLQGEVVKSGAAKIPEDAVLEHQGRELKLTGPRYFMLNKPQGVVCSHDDPFHATVFTLLDEIGAEKLHVAGRLDADTTGLVLLTDDGQWSHRITSPKHKCDKTYYVWTVDPISETTAEQFRDGVQLRGEKALTLPAQLQQTAECEAWLTIQEGKYHQVKRMFAAVGNKVDALHREAIGKLVLDEALQEGEYRALTKEEIAFFVR